MSINAFPVPHWRAEQMRDEMRAEKKNVEIVGSGDAFYVREVKLNKPRVKGGVTAHEIVMHGREHR